MKKICPLCGTENEEDARFCKECNEPLYDMKEEEEKLRKERDDFDEVVRERESEESEFYSPLALRPEKEEKKEKKYLMNALVIIAVVFIIFMIIDSGNGDNKKTPSDLEKIFVTSPNTLEREAEKIALDAFGKTVNWDSKPKTILSIRKYEQTSGPDKGGYLIEIEYRANDNLTVGMIKGGIFMDAIDFSKKIFQKPSCREIKIYMLKPFFTLIDKYGNEKEEQVAKLVLRRDIANKINWENITNDMFEGLLIEEGQLWLHPAFNK
jgi:hypothetical protein